MKTEQKTVDDLRKEIDVLSTSKNQHQAGVEEEQKKLKALQDETRAAEIATELAVDNKNKAVEAKKKAQDLLRITIEDAEEQEINLVSADSALVEKHKEIKKAEDKIVGLAEEYTKMKAALDLKIAMHKKSISDLCNQIKAMI